MRYCQGNVTGDNVCLAYIMGVADTFEGMRVANGRSPCAPPNIVGKQIRDVTVQFLDKNPARRNESAAGLVIEAMVLAWSCQ